MQICWSADDHRIANRQTSHRLDLSAAISAQRNCAPLCCVAPDQEYNFLAVIVAHRPLRYKNRRCGGKILAGWFIAEESHFNSHVGQDAGFKFKKKNGNFPGLFWGWGLGVNGA